MDRDPHVLQFLTPTKVGKVDRKARSGHDTSGELDQFDGRAGTTACGDQVIDEVDTLPPRTVEVKGRKQQFETV